MSLYKTKINPLTGRLQQVFQGNLVLFKAGVATASSLPGSGNSDGDARITNDDGHLHIWDGSAWQDQGDIVDLKWAALEDKPSSSVANIDDAVSKKHTQGTDTTLGAMSADINMNSHDLKAVSNIEINDSGEIYLDTAKEVSFGYAPGEEFDSSPSFVFRGAKYIAYPSWGQICFHTGEDGTGIWSPYIEGAAGGTGLLLSAKESGEYIKLSSAGNVRIDAPGIADAAGANGVTIAELKDAVDKKHSQNTDIALRTDKLTVDASGHTAVAGELKIKVYAQDAEPTLNANTFMAIWKDTNDSNRIYLVFRRAEADQVLVELA